VRQCARDDSAATFPRVVLAHPLCKPANIVIHEEDLFPAKHSSKNYAHIALKTKIAVMSSIYMLDFIIARAGKIDKLVRVLNGDIDGHRPRHSFSGRQRTYFLGFRSVTTQGDEP